MTAKSAETSDLQFSDFYPYIYYWFVIFHTLAVDINTYALTWV